MRNGSERERAHEAPRETSPRTVVRDEIGSAGIPLRNAPERLFPRQKARRFALLAGDFGQCGDLDRLYECADVPVDPSLASPAWWIAPEFPARERAERMRRLFASSLPVDGESLRVVELTEPGYEHLLFTTRQRPRAKDAPEGAPRRLAGGFSRNIFNAELSRVHAIRGTSGERVGADELRAKLEEHRNLLLHWKTLTREQRDHVLTRFPEDFERAGALFRQAQREDARYAGRQLAKVRRLAEARNPGALLATTVNLPGLWKERADECLRMLPPLVGDDAALRMLIREDRRLVGGAYATAKQLVSTPHLPTEAVRGQLALLAEYLPEDRPMPFHVESRDLRAILVRAAADPATRADAAYLFLRLLHLRNALERHRWTATNPEHAWLMRKSFLPEHAIRDVIGSLEQFLVADAHPALAAAAARSAETLPSLAAVSAEMTERVRVLRGMLKRFAYRQDRERGEGRAETDPLRVLRARLKIALLGEPTLEAGSAAYDDLRLGTYRFPGEGFGSESGETELLRGITPEERGTQMDLF